MRYGGGGDSAPSEERSPTRAKDSLLLIHISVPSLAPPRPSPPSHGGPVPAHPRRARRAGLLGAEHSLPARRRLHQPRRHCGRGAGLRRRDAGRGRAGSQQHAPPVLPARKPARPPSARAVRAQPAGPGPEHQHQGVQAHPGRRPAHAGERAWRRDECGREPRPPPPLLLALRPGLVRPAPVPVERPHFHPAGQVRGGWACWWSGGGAQRGSE